MLIFTGDFNQDTKCKQDKLSDSFVDTLGAREDWDNPEIYDILASCETDYQVQVGTEGLGEAIANFFAGLFQAIERLLESLFGGGSSGGGSSGGSSNSGSKASVTGTLKNLNPSFIAKIETLCKDKPDTEIKFPNETISQDSFDLLYKLQLDLVTWKEEIQAYSTKMPTAELCKRLVTCSNYKELHELQKEVWKFDTKKMNAELEQLIKSKASAILGKIPDIKTFLQSDSFSMLEQLGFKFNPAGYQVKAPQAMEYLKDLHAADDDKDIAERNRKVDKEFKTTLKTFKRYRNELKNTHPVKYDETAADNPAFVDGEDINKFKHKGHYSGQKARKLLTQYIGGLRTRIASVIAIWFKYLSGFRVLNIALIQAKRQSDFAVKHGFEDYFKNQTGTECAITIYRTLGGN